jgi:GST-like protein
LIDLHFWTTPNAYKVLIFLEEAALPYRLVPVNISKGEQFAPDFLEISPNNRIPAIVDLLPADGRRAIPVFESGAILQYLAGKTGLFHGATAREALEIDQWLFWQMAGLGPMAGQNHHFNYYAPEKLPYAMTRYVQETNRLYGVLEKRLGGRSFIAGEAYSIADMACYPWMILHKRAQQDISQFPAIQVWLARIAERPAVQRAYEAGARVNEVPVVTDATSRQVLFGQTARAISG